MKAGLIALCMLFGGQVAAQDAVLPPCPAISHERVISLHPGPAQGGGEIIWLRVEVGPLPRGAVLHLSTPDGSWSDALTPFGTPPDTAGLVFQVAVPVAAAGGGQLDLIATISEPDGKPARPPTAAELRGISLLDR